MPRGDALGSRPVRRYASALSGHGVPAHAIGETTGDVLEQLDGEDTDFVVCFAFSHVVGAFDAPCRTPAGLLGPGAPGDAGLVDDVRYGSR
jgi:hypothetical protein